MKKQWNLLMVLIFALVIVLLSIANVNEVPFNFLVGSANLPLILVIVISLMAGVILVGSFTYLKIYRQRRQISRLEREIRRMAAQLHPGDGSEAHVEGAPADDNDEEETRSSIKKRSHFRR
ncbi:LapA family protein [Sporolactobacillus pectinivorans]|uniref:LapA family protein n=1 Tax=Sporolactobacillus pectinivorans TaxID=1591408 RepID=UPI000C261F36|nr:LapA family protein [Sporolactobacillus pectinivorans]